jgi:hypothetical protein
MKLDASIICAGIGGAVGGYLSWHLGNDLYAGLGAGAGVLIGGVIGWVYRIWLWRRRKRREIAFEGSIESLKRDAAKGRRAP